MKHRPLFARPAVACALTATAAVAGCASPPTGPPAGPMTLSQYAQVPHDSPYLFKACVKGASLTCLGVQHSRVLESDSIAAVVREFARASPSRVLVEGQVPTLSPSFEHAVTTWGEPGASAFLARERALGVESLDRPLDEQAQDLRQTFGDERAVAFYGLRILAQERSQTQAAFNVDDFLGQRMLPWMQRNAISARLLSAAEFRALVKTATAVEDAIEAADPSWFSPLAATDRFGFRTIARYLVKTRDLDMAARVVQALRSGLQVFAVAGHSHVVMQEPALRQALGCEPLVGAPGLRRTSPSLARCDDSCGAQHGEHGRRP